TVLPGSPVSSASSQPAASTASPARTRMRGAAPICPLPRRTGAGPLGGEGLWRRLLHLGGGEGALEAVDHLPVAVDRERPGLARQPPLAHLRAEAVLDVVVVVDLLVDERDLAVVLGGHLRGDVLHR